MCLSRFASLSLSLRDAGGPGNTMTEGFSKICCAPALRGFARRIAFEFHRLLFLFAFRDSGGIWVYYEEENGDVTGGEISTVKLLVSIRIK